MNSLIARMGIVVVAMMVPGAFAEDLAYQQSFEAVEVGKVPDEFLILDGAFAVVQNAGNRVLELPGAPLDTFGLLFGPTAKEGLMVEARILGTAKGRRFPVLGVGLNGAVPFRLQVTPAKKALELYKGDELLVSVPYAWESGNWTQFRLQVLAGKGGAWQILGKAWKEGAPEPESWLVKHNAQEEPSAGRASVWGKPFSELPIQFDDLKVTRLPK